MVVSLCLVVMFELIKVILLLWLLRRLWSFSLFVGIISYHISIHFLGKERRRMWRGGAWPHGAGLKWGILVTKRGGQGIIAALQLPQFLWVPPHWHLVPLPWQARKFHVVYLLGLKFELVCDLSKCDWPLDEHGLNIH